MNFEAHAVFTEAQRTYLIANGWVEYPHGKWTHEGNGKRKYTFGHAVNSQLYYDRGSVSMLPEEAKEKLPAEQAEEYRKKFGPWTPEEQVVRFKHFVKRAFYERHKPRVPGLGIPQGRQAVRAWIRSIARLSEPTTHLERARRRRAEHAKSHKPKGCECGKEGPPW